MDIKSHPIWSQTTPYKTKIPSIKKPFHLLRIKLAKEYAKFFDNSVFVGITGSVGKTTCTSACLAVLSQKYKTIATVPSLDPVLNIPITILKLRPSIKKAIFEMGIEYPGEMDFYLSLIRPKTAIVTKIAMAHSQFLGDIDEISHEKGKLVEQLPKDGVAILNYDDINCRKLSEKCQAEVIYFGTDARNCDIWAGNIRIDNFKTIFELNFGVERVSVEYKLLGVHQIYPALAAAALGLANEISLIKIKKALESIEPAEHRLVPVTGSGNSIILDDTYNASPDAFAAAIDTLMQIPAKRRILVLGEMRELGDFSENQHRELARRIFKEKIDLVILIGSETRYVSDELKLLGFLDEKILECTHNSQIVSQLLKVLSKGDLCLIKGSRAVRLDEVVNRISKKH